MKYILNILNHIYIDVQIIESLYFIITTIFVIVLWEKSLNRLSLHGYIKRNNLRQVHLS